MAAPLDILDRCASSRIQTARDLTYRCGAILCALVDRIGDLPPGGGVELMANHQALNVR